MNITSQSSSKYRHAYLSITGEVPPSRGLMMTLTFSVMTLLALNVVAALWRALEVGSFGVPMSSSLAEAMTPLLLLGVGSGIGAVFFGRGYLHFARSTEASQIFLSWIANSHPNRR